MRHIFQLICILQKATLDISLENQHQIHLEQEHFSLPAELDQSQTVIQQSGQQAWTMIAHVITGNEREIDRDLVSLKKGVKHPSSFSDIFYCHYALCLVSC